MRRYIGSMLLLLAGAGCEHLPGPAPVRDLPGAPPANEILADITAADRIIENFSGNGVIRMRLPGEAATQRFDRSHVRFIPPGNFFAHASKLGYEVRIYVNGETFLLEIPADRVFYFGQEGDYFDDAALEVAPSLIFRELFLPNTLAASDDERAAVLAYDEPAARAALSVSTGPMHRTPQWTLTVDRGPEGWQLTESERLADDGRPRARTTWEEYATVDGVYMARKITATLPEGDGTLGFELKSNYQLNRETPRPVDDVRVVRRQLLEKGYREIRGISGGIEDR